MEVARLYAYAEATDHVFEWLETAFDTGDPNFPYLGILPYHRDLRDDPRFAVVEDGDVLDILVQSRRNRLRPPGSSASC